MVISLFWCLCFLWVEKRLGQLVASQQLHFSPICALVYHAVYRCSRQHVLCVALHPELGDRCSLVINDFRSDCRYRDGSDDAWTAYRPDRIDSHPPEGGEDYQSDDLYEEDGDLDDDDDGDDGGEDDREDGPCRVQRAGVCDPAARTSVARRGQELRRLGLEGFEDLHEQEAAWLCDSHVSHRRLSSQKLHGREKEAC